MSKQAKTVLVSWELPHQISENYAILGDMITSDFEEEDGAANIYGRDTTTLGLKAPSVALYRFPQIMAPLAFQLMTAMYMEPVRSHIPAHWQYLESNCQAG